MKKIFIVFIISLTIGLTLFACSPQQVPDSSTATNTVELSYTSTISPTVEPTRPPPAETMPPATRESVSFQFSERGPYWTGNRVYTFVDNRRNGRKIDVQIYYPALKEANDVGGYITRGAAPDMSSAPYPLILTGTNSGDVLFKSHLASYGFVMAIVRYPEWYDDWDYGIIDHPRDMLFTLDQIATNSLEGLEGVVDSDHVGVAGYSWEGFYSLALSGVRIDPDYYFAYCEQAPTLQPALEEWYLKYTCDLAKKWDVFAAYLGDEITVSDDGLWQPVTDKRIQAVMPMAPDGAWLYGERGLAKVAVPVLMIQATEDSLYQPTEAAFIFENLGPPERFMISFVGKEHLMVFESEPANRMKHFAVAFFGYYLQGRQDYAEGFSEDFVSQVDDLAWGEYKR